MKKIFCYVVLLSVLPFISCKKEKSIETIADSAVALAAAKSGNSGHIKIAILSDIHYMHPSLLQNNAQNGLEFNKILQTEPYKVLLEYSPAIFSEILSGIMYEKPNFVLVAGDMAKDGEKVSHEAVAGYFNQLQSKGIKVYVVPGNNDINNPSSLAYSGNTSSPVPNISPAEFTAIYGGFGYNSAISHDPNSLSYVAEAAPGLWILAIDAERYSPTYDRSGRIKPETMGWIKQQMMIANQNSITVLGLMHHNLIEHFSGQAVITPKTLVEDLSGGPADNDNWKARADSLVAWGLKIIFTGHSHVTDISERVTNDRTQYDVATGSLVTPPSPYRIAVLKNKEIDISTRMVESISMALPGNQSFVEYSNKVLSNSLDNYFRGLLKVGSFHLTEPTLSYTIPLARNAYMAYLAGDEKISPPEQMKIDSLNFVTPRPDTTIWAITTFWADPGVKDQKWHFKLINP
jgi:3',5'-cyclic AMP phosphodiesterase CpdA